MITVVIHMESQKLITVRIAAKDYEGLKNCVIAGYGNSIADITRTAIRKEITRLNAEA